MSETMELPKVAVPSVMGSPESVVYKPDGDSNLLSCPNCFFCSYFPAAMEQHIKQVHAQDKQFVCNECGVGCDTKLILDHHKRAKHDKLESGEFREMVHGPKQDHMTIHQCGVCGKKFIRKQLLKIHMRKVHLKLARMNKMDDGISAARTPTMAEETPEEFKEIAVKVAKEPESINMLFQQNLNPEGKKFICLLCYNHYKNKSHIKDHIRGVHLKLQLFECEFCEQKFRYKGALRVHRAKIHSTINASEADKKPVVTIIVTDHDAVIPVTMPPVAPKEPDDNNNPRTPTHSGKFCSRIASPALSKSVRKSPRKSRTASPIHVGDKDKFEFKINCSQCERKFPSPLKLKRHVSMAHYGSRRN